MIHLCCLIFLALGLCAEEVQRMVIATKVPLFEETRAKVYVPRGTILWTRRLPGDRQWLNAEYNGTWLRARDEGLRTEQYFRREYAGARARAITALQSASADYHEALAQQWRTASQLAGLRSDAALMWQREVWEITNQATPEKGFAPRERRVYVTDLLPAFEERKMRRALEKERKSSADKAKDAYDRMREQHEALLTATRQHCNRLRAFELNQLDGWETWRVGERGAALYNEHKKVTARLAEDHEVQARRDLRRPDWLEVQHTGQTLRSAKRFYHRQADLEIRNWQRVEQLAAREKALKREIYVRRDYQSELNRLLAQAQDCHRSDAWLHGSIQQVFPPAADAMMVIHPSKMRSAQRDWQRQRDTSSSELKRLEEELAEVRAEIAVRNVNGAALPCTLR